jgi:hypothetical protein
MELLGCVVLLVEAREEQINKIGALGYLRRQKRQSRLKHEEAAS